MYYDQGQFDIRCEWGEAGVRTLAADADVIVIVDVLSFCTSVDIAVSRGAVVYPFRWKDERAEEFARSVGALLPGSRGDPFSLSPASMSTIKPGMKVVLPSQNGASLSLTTGQTPTLAGCLRNSGAIAQTAMRIGRRIAVIPAGERWDHDHSLRPAIEDLIGAGAVVRGLRGTRSPEAQAAVAAFEHARNDLANALRNCASGRELIQRGFDRDVELASEYDVSQTVPVLRDGAYVANKP